MFVAIKTELELFTRAYYRVFYILLKKIFALSKRNQGIPMRNIAIFTYHININDVYKIFKKITIILE